MTGIWLGVRLRGSTSVMAIGRRATGRAGGRDASRTAMILTCGSVLAALPHAAMAGVPAADDLPAVAAASAAPDAPTDTQTIGEDITVTARRRTERAQDVPIALNVVSSKLLEARGDYTLGAVQQSVPSLQIFSFNPRNTNINIRGLGSNVAITNDGLENGVGVYIDDVFYGRVGQSQFDLVDLDRIEVLRGPQGTLFGKNTTAGAINITSKVPTFDTHFAGEASGGNYGYYQLRGTLTGGLIDNLLAGRISVATTKRDGFIENVGSDQDIHNYRNLTVRGQLLVTPADKLTIRLIGDYNRQRQRCCINLTSGLFTQYDNGTTIANNFAQRTSRLGYAPLTYDAFARVTDADAPIQANMNSWGFSGKADYDLWSATLTSITAYRHWNWFPHNDSDSTALSVLTFNQQQNRQRQFSQELRLASSGDRKIDYVFGGYYFHQIVKGYGKVGYGSDAPNWYYPTRPVALARVAVSGFGTQSESTPRTDSLAAFGQTTWHTTERLSLTTGLRFTHEKKQGSFDQRQVTGQSLAGLSASDAAAAQAIQNALNPAASYEAHLSNNSLSGLATLGWKLAPDVLAYATYSHGTKSGGLNLAQIPAGVPTTVKPEHVNNYEIGLKSQIFDRALTLNLAGFWTNVRDYQSTIIQQVVGTNSFLNYLANVPKVRSRGVEGDAAWTISHHASVYGSFAYTDARYVRYPNGPTPVEALDPTPANPAGSPSSDFKGRRLAGVPTWSVSAGGDVSQPIGDSPIGGLGPIELYSHADYSYRTNYYTVVSDSRYGKVPGYGVVNLRVGLRTEDGHWDLSGWAKNLTNKNYDSTLAVNNTGLVTAILGDPRTYGVTLRTSF